MSVGVLGKRYASALMDLATAADSVDRIGRDLRDAAATYADSRELRSLFENPSFSQDVRRGILKEIAAQAKMHDHVRDLLQLLSDRHRMSSLPEIADAYDALAEQRSGRLRAEVVSATELPDSYYTELASALSGLTGKEVEVVKGTDPSLLGGVVTKIGDQVYDGSLRNRLAELQDELLK